MTTDLRDLFADLVADQPEHRIDLDDRIAAGRRRVRRRTAATATATALAVAAIAALGVTLTPTTTGNGPAGTTLTTGTTGTTGTSSASPTLVCSGNTCYRYDEPGSGLGPGPGPRTDASRALGAELQRLAPEIAATAGANLTDTQWTQGGRPIGYLQAQVAWSYPQARGTDSVSLDAEVWSPKTAASAFSTGMPICGDHPDSRPCTRIEELSDGSTAYQSKQQEKDRFYSYDVWIVRPDRTVVHVASYSQMTPGTSHYPVLDLDRALEVAKGITVTL